MILYEITNLFEKPSQKTRYGWKTSIYIYKITVGHIVRETREVPGLSHVRGHDKRGVKISAFSLSESALDGSHLAIAIEISSGDFSFHTRALIDSGASG